MPTFRKLDSTSNHQVQTEEGEHKTYLLDPLVELASDLDPTSFMK
jgi:hypothetical protein